MNDDEATIVEHGYKARLLRYVTVAAVSVPLLHGVVHGVCWLFGLPCP